MSLSVNGRTVHRLRGDGGVRSQPAYCTVLLETRRGL